MYEEPGYAVHLSGAFIGLDGKMWLSANRRYYADPAGQPVRSFFMLESSNEDFSRFRKGTGLLTFPYGNGLVLSNGETLVPGYFGTPFI